MTSTLSVSAIKNGTVIDHIASGQGLRIIHLLSLQNSQLQITIGLRLPSKLIGMKDLIKIEDRILTDEEANEIVVFAADATINIIDNFTVVKKISTHLPSEMKNVFICPNPSCITQSEFIESRFSIEQQLKSIKLACHFCEKVFERDQVEVRI
ncbi:MAG: aspartate carbamoyltransferase regulatory subunit [Gammaproteobacteria bacterium]